jgi:hypothetical protein
MSTLKDLPEEIAKILKQWIKDETQLTVSELEKFAPYLVAHQHDDIGYLIAYKTMTKEQRIEARDKTNKLTKIAANTVIARKAARRNFVLGLLSLVIQALAQAVVNEVDRI